MRVFAKALAVVGLLLVMAFCAFGFLATFEPPGSVGLRIGYATVALACLVVIVWILTTVRRTH
jgi:hypothetical protein